MIILIACEFSGIVRDAFIARGHDAWSCDIIPTEKRGPHIVNDVRNVLNDGWDMMIAHPPCTFLSDAGIGYFNEQRYGQKAVERKEKREEAFQFFLMLYNADIPKIVIENPVGYANTHFRKPDQIIHPYFFGDSALKRTCLWLKGVPGLMWTMKGEIFGEPTATAYPAPVYVDRRRISGKLKKRYFTDAISGSTGKSGHQRSYTFPGIARAMAAQWGGVV